MLEKKRVLIELPFAVTVKKSGGIHGTFVERLELVDHKIIEAIIVWLALDREGGGLLGDMRGMNNASLVKKAKNRFREMLESADLIMELECGLLVGLK